jgi:PilZ domain
MNTDIPNPTASGIEVFNELREELDASGIDRRYRARYPWKAELTIWVIDEPHRDRGVREIHVETTDISTSGFGFVFRQYIHPGAMLRARLDVLPGKPIIDGIVAHCQMTEGSLHNVGVQFIKTY